MSDYKEDALIEESAIAIFAELGWETAKPRRTRDLLLTKLVSGEVVV